jgi:hypothetical protein
MSNSPVFFPHPKVFHSSVFQPTIRYNGIKIEKIEKENKQNDNNVIIPGLKNTFRGSPSIKFRCFG